MTSYSPVPLDANRTPMHGFPPTSSVVAVYNSENAAVSSVISLTHDTVRVEIASIGAPAVMRWVRQADTEASIVTAVSGANFHHVIPTATYRQFVVPQETGTGAVASAQGVNRKEGLYQRIAIKTTAGNASVLLTEYTVQAN